MADGDAPPQSKGKLWRHNFDCEAIKKFFHHPVRPAIDEKKRTPEN